MVTRAIPFASCPSSPTKARTQGLSASRAARASPFTQRAKHCGVATCQRGRARHLANPVARRECACATREAPRRTRTALAIAWREDALLELSERGLGGAVLGVKL